MQQLTINTFKFHELSDSSQKRAYQAWRDAIEDEPYDSCGDIDDVIKVIADKIGVVVTDYKYGPNYSDYRFKFQADNQECLESLSDFRATKKALGMFYKLTTVKQCFGKFEDNFNLGKDFGYDEVDRKFVFTKSRLSAFKKIEPCFTDHYLSNFFSLSLLDSIVEFPKATLYWHFKKAFDALFEEIEHDISQQLSFERFKDHVAQQPGFNYFENGQLIALSAVA